MSKKESEIISKLIKIANQQQTIILELAKKAQLQDPNVGYLNRAANLAAMNNNAQGKVVVNSDGDGNYTVQISGITEDNALKQKIIDDFYHSIDSQKPELTGKVNLLF